MFCLPKEFFDSKNYHRQNVITFDTLQEEPSHQGKTTGNRNGGHPDWSRVTHRCCSQCALCGTKPIPWTAAPTQAEIITPFASQILCEENKTNDRKRREILSMPIQYNTIQLIFDIALLTYACQAQKCTFTPRQRRCNGIAEHCDRGTCSTSLRGG